MFRSSSGSVLRMKMSQVSKPRQGLRAVVNIASGLGLDFSGLGLKGGRSRFMTFVSSSTSTSFASHFMGIDDSNL